MGATETEPSIRPEVVTPMPKAKPAGVRAIAHPSAPGILFWAAVLLMVPGCATVKPPPPKVPVVVLPAAPAAPAPAPAPPPRPAAETIPAPVSPAPAPPVAGEVPATRQIMLVESEPAGAVIVVDGRPVGKAPLRLDVPITPQGFFRADMEIRARFVARDATEVSRTAVEEFNPRERVPAVLRFTPDGAQRLRVTLTPERGAPDPLAKP